MILDLREVTAEGRLFEGTDPGEALELTERDLAEPAGSIRYALTAQLVSRELVVRGSLSADIRFSCSRCTRPFVLTVSDQAFACAREINLQPPASPRRSRRKKRGGGREKGAEPRPAGDESVDLTPEIREAILLAFPSQPVCAPDCRGLCPQCGIDLNEDRCECRPPADSRWDALGRLDLKKGT